MAAATNPARLKRVFIVFCDHSVLSVHRTRRLAEQAIRLRQQHTISNIVHFTLGPFVLERGAKVARLSPEWISRCTCGLAYHSEREWSALAYVGVMDFDDGSVLELRNCVACGSTISRRVNLKKGASKPSKRARR